MVANYVSWDVAKHAPMQEDAVTEDSAWAATFPTAFQGTAGSSVMVLVDTSLISQKSSILQALEQIEKAIVQSVVLNT